MKTKILYLYAEINPYNVAFFKTLIKTYNVEIHVVMWDKKRLKPYNPPAIDNVVFYNRSEFDKESIFKLYQSIKPKIIYVSGWMDKAYLFTTKKAKQDGIPVAVGFDDQWRGTLRQYIGMVIYRFYLSRYFTHAWIAGPRQYEFAKKLGFSNKNIIWDLLSCDTRLFDIEKNSNKINKIFLYVGNFREIKGIKTLVKAYKIYKEKFRGNWKLLCVGNGELEYLLKENNIEVLPFQSQENLVKIAEKCDAFILPSNLDQWGVVVHEFTTLGMPLILSEGVGASDVFLIDNFNGYSFKISDDVDLAKKMLKLSQMSLDELTKMKKNSKLLSKRITIKTSVANFISLLKEPN